RVVLAGAGVGITPLRALAEGLAYEPGEVVLLHRFTDQPLFAGEFQQLAARRGLRIMPLPGPRPDPGSVLGPYAAGHDETRVLQYWIPDLADSDVYICGPAGWAAGFEHLAANAGVPKDRIHTESFGW
ncbi:MAG: FAD-dependent oxidoreductase, partial [Microlunatus sp.]|nr:FAD-dependent oxidoreductase [Microlunatus sp.]